MLHTVTEWIFFGGFALEAAGLLVALRGFRRTWAEHPQNEKFLAPLTDTAARLAATGGNLLRRALRRRPRTKVVHAGGVASIGAAMSARAVVGWGSPPDITSDAEAFAAKVTERLDTLHRKIQDVEHELEDYRTAAKDDDARVKDELSGRLDQVEALTHNVAAGGLREQVFGWSLLVIGFALQGVAQILQFVTS